MLIYYLNAYLSFHKCNNNSLPSSLGIQDVSIENNYLEHNCSAFRTAGGK